MSHSEEKKRFEELENEATFVDHSYTADDIQVLDGLGIIKKRMRIKEFLKKFSR